MATLTDILHAKNLELEQQVLDLKQELADATKERLSSGAESTREHLARAFNLTPSESALAAALYTAGGRTLSKWVLEENLPYLDASGERDIKIVDVFICKIRKKMGAAAVTTSWGSGYYMSDEGKALVARALAGEKFSLPPATLNAHAHKAAKVRLEILAFAAAHPGTGTPIIAKAVGKTITHTAAELTRCRSRGWAISDTAERVRKSGRVPTLWWVTPQAREEFDLPAVPA